MLGILRDAPFQFLFPRFGVQHAQIAFSHVRDDRIDPHDGASVDSLETAAQHRMALRDRPQAMRERGALQRSLQTQCDRHAVRGPGTLQLVEKPQALLRERQRDGSLMGHLRDRVRTGRRTRVSERLRHFPGRIAEEIFLIDLAPALGDGRIDALMLEELRVPQHLRFLVNAIGHALLLTLASIDVQHVRHEIDSHEIAQAPHRRVRRL